MSDILIKNLPEASEVSSNDVLIIEQEGITKKVTADKIKSTSTGTATTPTDTTGLVKKIKANSRTYSPDSSGVVDLGDISSGSGGTATGTVKSITVNSIKHDPDNYGNIDLGTISGGTSSTTQSTSKADAPSKGYENFSVMVNYFENDDKTSTPNSNKLYKDYGVIAFPKNYSSSGNKTRLIIFCQGTGERTNSNTNPLSNAGWSYFLSKGYVVMDMNGMSSDWGTAKGFPKTTQHYCNKYILQSYKKGYDYAISKYNLYDEVFIIGLSMGGAASLLIVQNHIIPIIAHSLLSPTTSVYKNNYMKPWGGTVQSKTIAGQYGFDNWETTTVFDQAYFLANKDKIMNYDALFINTIGTAEDKNKALTNYNNTNETAGFNGMSKFYPIPLKIWQCYSDDVVDSRYSKYLVDMIKRGSGNAYYREMGGGNHGMGWISGTASDVDIENKPITTSTPFFEAIQFLQQFELSNIQYSPSTPVVSKPTGVTISSSSSSLKIKDTLTLTASVSMNTGSFTGTYTWSLSNDNLTKTGSGNSITITGAKEGSCIITCTAKDSNNVQVSSTKTITIVSTTTTSKPTGVTLTSTSDSIEVGGTSTITASVSMNAGSFTGTYTWTLQNSNVTKTGTGNSIVVTGSVAGSCQITCVAKDSNNVSVTANKIITITAKAAAPSGDISSPSFNFDFRKGNLQDSGSSNLTLSAPAASNYSFTEDGLKYIGNNEQFKLVSEALWNERKSFTLETYIQFNSNAYASIINFNPNFPGEGKFAIVHQSNGYMNFMTVNGGYGDSVTTTPIIINQFYHMIFSYDVNTDAKIMYLDGANILNEVVTEETKKMSQKAGITTMYIGSTKHGHADFTMKYLRYYNNLVITQEQATSLFNNKNL